MTDTQSPANPLPSLDAINAKPLPLEHATKTYRGEARKAHAKGAKPIITPNPNRKDRSHGGGERIKAHAVKPGEVRNPTGKGLMPGGNAQKLRSLYAKQGFSPEQVAMRMTEWLKMPYGKVLQKLNNDKTQMFERVGLSILVNAANDGDTTRLDKLLDRIIGPVIQRSEIQSQTLTVSANADLDLLKRIQLDLHNGKPLPLPIDNDA